MAESSRVRRLTGSVLMRVYRPRMLLLLAVLGGLAVATPQMLRLVRQLQDQPEYQIAADEVRLTPPPSHVPSTLIVDALERAELPNPFSRLQPDLASRLQIALAADPWIDEVHRVRVRRDGVELDLRYRSPALAVETNRGRFLVSSDGVLLPSEAAARLDLTTLPHLIGERIAPISTAGQRWRDRDVVAAAALATTLRATNGQQPSLWDRCRFQTLRARGPHQWDLTTTAGAHVYWGSHEDVVTEPSGEIKCRRLEKLLTQEKLGEGAQAYEVDLTLWDIVAVRPITVR